MINHINKFTTNGQGKYNRTRNNGDYFFVVYYDSGRIYRYTMHDNIPMSVVNVLLNGNYRETVYTDTGKVERFYPINAE